MQLTEQEIVRRKTLEKIRDLGVDPFPPERLDINFQTTDFSTDDYKQNIINALASIQGMDQARAMQIAEYLFKNRFRVQQLLDKPEELRAGPVGGPRIRSRGQLGFNAAGRFCHPASGRSPRRF
jgi:hypothetical protein